MKPRLSRPLLAAVVSGAVAAGGAVWTAPALAADPTPSASAPESPAPTSVPSDSASAPVSEPASPVPSVPASSAAVPSSPDPSSAVPSSAAPSTAVPSSAAPSSAAPSSPTPRPPVTTTKPAPPRDTTKPTGTFKLNAGAFWTGQKVVLTQNAADYGDKGPGDSDATLGRKISWGDGSTTTLAAGAKGAAKQYGRAGRFKVTVTIRDRAGNTFTTPARTVSVTVPGKVSLTKKSIYQGQSFGIKFAGVPAGTKTIGVNWGDGWVSGHRTPIRKGVITGTILYKKDTSQKLSGNFPIKVAFYNKLGASSYRTVGTIKVLKDTKKPVVKVTKPANANRIKSWRTVRGTVSDKGAGVRVVYVLVDRYNPKTDKAYCLTPNRKWKRYTTEQQFIDGCKGTPVAVKNGKWSFKVPSGLTKGFVGVNAWAYDWADNRKNTYREAKLTRS